MRPWRTYVSLLVMVIGIALIADALVRGTAQASIVLIVPVLSGGSPEFVVGTLLTFVGLLGVFLTAGALELDEGPPSSPGAPVRSGGVVLIGPVPIFFGEWRQMSARGRFGWVVAGALATAVLVLLSVWLWARG